MRDGDNPVCLDAFQIWNDRQLGAILPHCMKFVRPLSYQDPVRLIILLIAVAVLDSVHSLVLLHLQYLWFYYLKGPAIFS